jgi:hypothetical protein
LPGLVTSDRESQEVRVGADDQGLDVRPLRKAVAILGMFAVFCSQYLWIRSTNFGGADEWLLIDLASRGILGIPYANRPLLVLWFLPAAHLIPNSLLGFYLVCGVWLALGGFMVFLLCRRLAPGQPALWFLAGTLCLTWVPADYMRLDVVLLTGYAGGTFSTLLAIVLFVESYFHKSYPLLALGGVIAVVTARGGEVVLPLLLGAPFLLGAFAPNRGRRFWAFALLWEGIVLATTLAVGLGFLESPGGTYQASALGFDPLPWNVGLRLARQFAYHLSPLVATPVGELLHPAVPLSAAVFVAASLAVGGVGPMDSTTQPPSKNGLLRLMGVGVGMAALAYAPFCLSSRILGPARTQLLSAPGIGILLAAAVCLGASWLPARWRRWAWVVAGAWIVAVGSARTVSMQREWDAARSLYPEQHRLLAGLTRRAPAVKPHTLFVLIDDEGAFPLSFTFRHAIQYLYPGQAAGFAPVANDFLYPTRFVPEGVLTLPWPVIRAPWDAPPTLHRYDELIVLRPGAGEEVEILGNWPRSLPQLPVQARYDPWARVESTQPPPAHQAILQTVDGPASKPPSPTKGSGDHGNDR